MVYVRCSVPVENRALLHIPGIFRRIEIAEGNVDAIFQDDENLRIMIDKENYFLQTRDPRGLGVVVMQRLHYARIRKQFGYTGLANDVIACRQIAREAPDDLIYFSYISLVRKEKKISGWREFAEINMPWISFHGISTENEGLMKEAAGHFECPKAVAGRCMPLIESMKTDLRQRNNYEAFRKMEEALADEDNKI